ncbi:FAD-dependent oxidoreductase [Niameybacter massiliensis]|uniref:FAD-dependent oxidoreductase n=1 Tax=Holtiella tumoricola TaxID=3018743 RepID=A0AA42DNT3_9FIRM|nr:FAD-dependent oxidoreductase [Holtiella tumoricola]MDA3731923.1 FAD-dependent oxidoreductase [Holtiella tumoricola]
MEYTKKIEVAYDVDVCVAGGGPAGVAAAVSAARQGVKVLLIESQGFFGGAGTAGLVPAFMPFENGVDFLADGIGREIYEASRQDPSVIMDRTVGIQLERLKKIYDDLVVEAGVEFLFFSQVIDVIKKGRNIEALIVSTKSGLLAVKAKVFIDTTGDADVCALSGVAYTLGDEKGNTMPASLCSLWADIEWGKMWMSHTAFLEEAFKDHVFTQEDRHIPGFCRAGKTSGGANIGHVFNVDATNVQDLTQAMIKGRKILREFETYFTKYVKEGYENAFPMVSASYLGVRESRRIQGEYVMTIEDFMNRASFEDEIGRFSYPVDIHIANPSKDAYDAFVKEHSSLRYADGESYGIPYRALLPKELDNLLVAGRCISADRQMLSSVRVMPACFITGQAVGVAAALSIDKGWQVKEIDIKALQKRLKAIGAFLPNFTEEG